jgi:hypothetical protein
VKAGQADPLLDEIVEFTGQILFIDTKVPGLVIGAVRNGEVSVRGFGERAGPGSPPPDGDTLLRIDRSDAWQVIRQQGRKCVWSKAWRMKRIEQAVESCAMRYAHRQTTTTKESLYE